MDKKRTRVRSKLPIKEQKNRFLQSLVKNMGILTPCLAECHISYQTYAKWFKNDPEFRSNCIGIEDLQADFVESKLMQLIEEGNPTAILFYLKCRRPEKWRDRQVLQVEGQVDHNIKQINIYVPDNDTKLLMNDTLKLIDINGKEINE